MPSTSRSTSARQGVQELLKLETMILSLAQMRRPFARWWRLRRLGLAVAAGLLLAASCRGTRGATMPRYLGDSRDSIDVSKLDPVLAKKWEALTRAVDADPAAPEIPKLADEVLDAEPPLEVQVAALRHKAVHAHARGQDMDAIALAEDGLRRAGSEGHPADAVAELVRVRVQALVRSGDPSQALEAIGDPRVRGADVFDEPALHGLRAVALERQGQLAQALGALALWRSSVGDAAPEALFAEERLHALAPSIDAAEIAAVAAELPDGSGPGGQLARACLLSIVGKRALSGDVPRWVARCGRRPDRIGVLLPRTGPLSALADTQLGAASIAVATLSGQDSDRRDAAVLWADAGATPAEAVRGARALIGAGADAIIGPIGPSSIDAVSAAVGDRIEVVVPGEARAKAKGVAPSLEARVNALIEHARAVGVTRFIVIAPDAAYGRRAVKAVQAKLEGKEAKALIVQTYPPSTTSFGPVLLPVMPALGKGTALVVPDHMTRVEGIVRQLVRSGAPPAAPSSGLLVLTTGEGAEPAALERGRKVFDEVLVAPVAAPTAATDDFVDAYRSAEGAPPGDQALLVYFAFRRALVGDASPSRATVLEIHDGRLVPP
jgi:ABC-type branched-subunit amino acid transport system substrate-binding protein